MAASGRFMKEVVYTGQDLRFTTKGDDVLYVIALGQPEGALKIRSLGRDFKMYPDQIASVELVGRGKIEGWSHDGQALNIPISGTLPEELANVWKITRAAPMITRGR